MDVKKAREILGTKAVHYTNEELEEILSTFEILAEIAIENYLMRKKFK